MSALKIVIERHPDTYVAYPLGIKGVVVGQGDTYEAAVADLKSALQFHLETFGADCLQVDPPILEAFIAEDMPWAHIDMAGTMWADSSKPLTPAGPTGYGVRLLDALAREWRAAQ